MIKNLTKEDLEFNIHGKSLLRKEHKEKICHILEECGVLFIKLERHCYNAGLFDRFANAIGKETGHFEIHTSYDKDTIENIISQNEKEEPGFWDMQIHISDTDHRFSIHIYD